MKKYIKPLLCCIEIRAEERLAVCDTDGVCSVEVPDGFLFDPNGIPDQIYLS